MLGTPSFAAAPDPYVTEARTIGLLEGIRTGVLRVSAEGTGGDRMNLSVTNRSTRRLRVVLPPGLVAAGAAGQFGGGCDRSAGSGHRRT
jgi:hypothetical protein